MFKVNIAVSAETVDDAKKAIKSLCDFHHTGDKKSTGMFSRSRHGAVPYAMEIAQLSEDEARQVLLDRKQHEIKNAQSVVDRLQAELDEIKNSDSLG